MKPMLATPWDGEDPTGWFLSEKLDGLRAVWTGSELLSREGHPFRAPAWFIAGLPAGLALDGELYGGVGTLAKVSGMFRRLVPIDVDWQAVKLHVFDVPVDDGNYTGRMLRALIAINKEKKSCTSALFTNCVTCTGIDHLAEFALAILARGGEGVMLRHPSAPYQSGRSKSLLKFKPAEYINHALALHRKP